MGTNGRLHCVDKEQIRSKNILILSNQYPLTFINSPRNEYTNLDVSHGISIYDTLTTAAWCGRDV
jgi:hypothetical protein